MATRFIDYYEILEVNHRASLDVIRNAYRALAKCYHPDRLCSSKAGSEKTMVAINEAFDVLSDPVKRSAYDKTWITYHQPPESPNSVRSPQNSPPKCGQQKPPPRFANRYAETLSEMERICSGILIVLEKNIVHNEGAEHIARNKRVCEQAVEEFILRVPRSMDLLKESSESNKMAERIVSLTFWRISTGFTWANDYKQAHSSIMEALKYADPDADYYPRLQKVACDIERSAAIRERKLEKAEKRPRICLNPKIAALVLLLGIFFLFQVRSSPSNATRTLITSLSGFRTSQIADSSEVPWSALSSAQSIQAISWQPKSNVVSQYVASEPRLNVGGYCEITLDNQLNEYPVFVRIWNVDGVPKAIRTITVRQGELFTAKSVTAGKYEIRYALLYENSQASRATRSEPFTLTQREEAGGTRYTQYSLTIYTVPQGNVQPRAIPLSEI